MISSIGGIILIIGAYFTYKGEIFKAVLTYMFADLIWIYLGILAGDGFGTILIAIGAGLGIMAFFKMKNGEYNKTIHKN